MSGELIYTSAPRGLRPGSQGYCVVAMTPSLPSVLTEKLESLSAYRPLFQSVEMGGLDNPILHAHYKIRLGGKNYHVLIRSCISGLDYSQRSNILAHHFVLQGDELSRGGPAWLFSQRGFMQTCWNGSVGYLTVRVPPQGDTTLGVCRTWLEATGDAGWAGVLAEAFIKDPTRPAYIVFQPGQDPLPFVAEALSLIPVEQRWNVTFNTYFTALHSDVKCAWRCVARPTPEARAALGETGALVICVDRELPAATGGALVEWARIGVSPQAKSNGVLGSESPIIGKTRSATSPRVRRSATPDDEVVSGVADMSAPPIAPSNESQVTSDLRSRLAYFEAAATIGFVLVLLLLGIGGYLHYAQVSGIRAEMQQKETKWNEELEAIRKTSKDQQSIHDKSIGNLHGELQELAPVQEKARLLERGNKNLKAEIGALREKVDWQQKELKLLKDKLPID